MYENIDKCKKKKMKPINEISIKYGCLVQFF